MEFDLTTMQATGVVLIWLALIPDENNSKAYRTFWGVGCWAFGMVMIVL